MKKASKNAFWQSIVYIFQMHGNKNPLWRKKYPKKRKKGSHLHFDMITSNHPTLRVTSGML